MGSYFNRYMNDFRRSSCAISAAKKAYDARMKQLEGYEGSGRYETEKDRARTEFENRLKEARQSRDDLTETIQHMREAASLPVKAEPPTDEQLRLLETIRLVDHPDNEMVQGASLAMEGCDLGMKALKSILSEKGQILPTRLLPRSERIQAAVNDLARAAGSLLAWDGSTAEEVRRDLIRRRHEARWAGGRPLDGNDYAAEFASEVNASDPFEPGRKIAARIVGDDPEVLDALERL